jgi:hypothetical protein
VSNESEINIFKALDFIRDNAPAYAQAKAQRVYLEEFRKTKKALCMKAAESYGNTTAASQEREAYADPAYVEILEGLKAAVEKEEALRWMIVAAQAKIEVWRTIEANRRAEAKAL